MLLMLSICGCGGHDKAYHFFTSTSSNLNCLVTACERMSRKRRHSPDPSDLLPLSLPVDDNAGRSVGHVKLDTEILSDLVLENCAAKMQRNPLKHRICAEIVSRRFAFALQTVYNRERIALVIERFDRTDVNTQNYQHIFTDPLRRANGNKRRRHEFRLCDSDPKNQLRLLFARFKRFRCITLRADGVKFVTGRLLDILRFKKLRPIEMDRLEYKLDLHTEDVDFRLIAKFAPMLKDLLLECLMPRTEYMAKKLWIAVAKCAKLQRLYFVPQDNIGYLDRDGELYLTPPDLFSMVYLQECLKVIKIRHFHCNAAYKIFNSRWAEAFVGNQYLQRLFINGCSAKLYSSSSAQPVISTLRTLDLDYYAERKRPQDEMAELTALLRMLPSNGYLTVFHLVDWHPNPWWFRPQKQTISNEESTLKSLQFWLRLSNETTRTIKLCLRFYRNPIASVTEALEALTDVGSTYSSLTINRTLQRVVLHYQRARIILSVTDAGDQSTGIISAW